MSTRTIGQIKTKIQSRLHGATLNQVSDFYTICQDAAEMMLSRIDPQETIRKIGLINPIYTDTYDYSLPEDFKSPADLNPQANADQINNSDLSRTYSRDFINRKKDNQFAIVWRDAVQFMRFSKKLSTPVLFDSADSIYSGDTEWEIGGNASNLTEDSFNFIAGAGSLRCDVSNSGALVNVNIRIGNDNSNYYTKTITTGHFEAFKIGWNLLRFDFSTATLVGVVDTSTMSYVKITTTYNTSQTAYFEKTLTLPINLSENNYTTDGAVFLYQYFDSLTSLSILRLDNIVVSTGTLYDITYYSNHLFRTNAGVWITKPTIDTDIVNLSDVSYKIFEAEICRIIAQEIQGASGSFDYAYWNTMLEGDSEDNSDRREGLYDRYMRQYPSERIEGTISYYDTNIDEELSPNLD